MEVGLTRFGMEAVLSSWKPSAHTFANIVYHLPYDKNKVGIFVPTRTPHGANTQTFVTHKAVAMIHC